MAVSPPPTTATIFPLKKGASQGAQEEIPRPISSFSPGTPSHTFWAPVAITTAFVKYFSSPTKISNGVFEKSTFVTDLLIISAPRFSACFRILAIKSGPSIPSGKPGKLSTFVVNISCPPQDSPAKIKVEAAPRVV